MDNPYKNIIASVFWRHYAFLVVGGLIVILAVSGIWPSLKFYRLSGMLLALVLRTVLVQTRYVAGFAIREGELVITYITPFFNQREYCIDLKEVRDIRLEGFLEMHVITIVKWESFDLSSKKIGKDVAHKLLSGGMDLPGFRNQIIACS